jgi:hypothetical protein
MKGRFANHPYCRLSGGPPNAAVGARMACPYEENSKKILPAGRFVPINLASGRQRATNLALYCRLGEVTRRG